MSRKLKIGLALGGGSARGLTHIGILKVLHKYQIYPDFIAGTSIGSVIGAVYAAGHSPEEMEEIAKTTDWRNIFDFTIPKFGLIGGYLIEKKLKKLTSNKSFHDLKIPFRVVAVDIDAQEEVIFSQGNVARAVHASLAIPGFFTPVKIGRKRYLDGGLINPTPFNVVKKMGADVILAVDLFHELKTTPGPPVPHTTLFDELKKKFIAEELLNFKYYLTPSHFPDFIIRLLHRLFDRLLSVQKVLRILTRKEPLPIFKVIYNSTNILSNALAQEKLKNAPSEVCLIAPSFAGLTWTDFDQAEKFIRLGEIAMEKKIPEVKRRLGLK